MKTLPLSFRIAQERLQELDEIGQQTDKSRSQVAIALLSVALEHRAGLTTFFNAEQEAKRMAAMAKSRVAVRVRKILSAYGISRLSAAEAEAVAQRIIAVQNAEGR